MKVAKQQLVLYILSKGNYKVDAELGVLLSLRKSGEWEILKPAVQPTGQKQVAISHEGTSVRVYLRIFWCGSHKTARIKRGRWCIIRTRTWETALSGTSN